jgi:hypothetical protein
MVEVAGYLVVTGRWRTNYARVVPSASSAIGLARSRASATARRRNSSG